MSPPIAYLITWTTYGSWLHGDARTSVDRQHPNNPNTPRIAPMPGRARFESSELRHEPVRLDGNAREIVAETIRGHAAIRRWVLHAINVRSNHVHVVVSCACRPEKAMGEFKAWSSRRLRESGPVCEKVWTRHGSTRHIFSAASLNEAIAYVMDRQGADI